MNDVDEVKTHDEQTATDDSVDTKTEHATGSDGLPEKASSSSVVTGNIQQDKDDYFAALNAIEAAPEPEAEQEQSVTEEVESEEATNDIDPQEFNQEDNSDVENPWEEVAEAEESVEAEAEEVVEGEIEQEQAKSVRLRLQPTNDLDAAALQLKKSNPELTLDKALEMAKVQLGLPTEVESKVVETEQEAEVDVSEEATASVQDLKAQIRQKDREAIDAMSGEYDTDAWKAALEEKMDLEDQLEAAEQARVDALKKAETSEADKQAEFQREFSEHDQLAASKYEANGITNPNSRFNQRMAQINQAWETQGDPRFYAADKSMLIADSVALELGVVAGQKTKALDSPKAPTTKPITAPRKTQAAPKPASGNARTNVATQPSMDALLEAADTPEKYEALMEKLG